MGILRPGIFILLLLSSSISNAQQRLPEADEQAIRAVLDRQSACWNKGDLECFMNGYWESDSLKFIGSKGITYGWHATLDRYRHSYPDRATMGQLNFTILSVEQLGPESALVIGKWHLTRDKGNVGGHFSLVWRQIKGEWVIVADHSS